MGAKGSRGAGRKAPWGAMVLAAALGALPGAQGREATGYLAKEREAQERRQRAWTPGTKLRDCPVCPEMVVAAAGSFRMGTPPEGVGSIGLLHEGPAHEVTIGRPFAVGVYEVTRGELARFVSETGRSMGDSCWTYEGGEWEERSGRHWMSPGYSQTDSHPVVCVDWNDAKAYVRWLSGKTGHEYRLPSEAEWEYVARARTGTSRYWGEGESDQCRHANGADASADFGLWAGCDDGFSRAAPVGSFAPNGYKLHDVLGNVSEWVEDCWAGSYHGAPRDGSTRRYGDCSSHILRGGSWFDAPWNLRAAYRDTACTGFRSSDAGFRVARTLTP